MDKDTFLPYTEDGWTATWPQMRHVQLLRKGFHISNCINIILLDLLDVI